MDLGLGGRVAIVTGASKGLGYSAANALAAEGARLVISSRRTDELEAAAGQLRGAGTDVVTMAADVADPTSAGALVAKALDAFGQLDVVVASNGGPPPMTAIDSSDDDLRAAFESTVVSMTRLVRAAIVPMRAQGWGRICLVGSYSVVQALPNLSLSNVTRAGLWGWVKTAAADVAADGITINVLCPGPHRTDRMVALAGAGGSGAMGDPDDFGRTAAFLCSTSAAFINGAALVVDGGQTTAL